MARRAAKLYRLHLALAIAGLALLMGAGAIVVGNAELSLPTAAEVAGACDRWLADGGPGAVVALAVAAASLLSLLLGLRSAWRQIRGTRRYLKSYSLTERIVRVEGQRCRLLDSDQPQAFCAGFLRPQLDELSPAELRAVLAHEQHHLRRRDPLRLLLARASAEALFFVPLLRRSSERYEALGELAADEAAVGELAAPGPLASALLKFSGGQAPPAPVIGIAPERVDHLLGDRKASGWRLPRSLVERSLIALAGLGILIVLLLQIQPGAQVPALLAAGCMIGMVGGPILLALAALRFSHRALTSRRQGA